MKTSQYSMPRAKRDHLQAIIAGVLAEDAGVVFAYLLGSFLTKDVFRDIDVFVFVKDDIEPFSCAARLKDRLAEKSRETGYNVFSEDDFDVRIINAAPYDFMINVLLEGALIVDKDPGLRTDYIERVSDEYRANYFILDEAYR